MKLVDWIIKNLVELGDYAKGSAVNILLESHGKVVYSDMLYENYESSGTSSMSVWFGIFSICGQSPKEIA